MLTVEGVYGKLSPWEKAVVDPIEKTDAAYVKEWLESPSQGLPFKADDPFTFFYKGVRMRSMSEVYIATLLDNYNIPFLYEKPLKLAGRVIYPDFSALDMRNRREVYWEHMGLMDNPGYYQDAVRKIRSYTYSGIYLGDRLLITQGTSYSGLDMSEAERLLCWRFGKKNVHFSSKIAGRGGA